MRKPYPYDPQSAQSRREFFDPAPRILERVTLAFDPAGMSAALRRVFEDDVARTVWLAVRPGHLVDDHFDENCLTVAKWVRTRKARGDALTVGWLNGALHSLGMVGTAERPFCELLLPFMRGERQISYEWDWKSE